MSINYKHNALLRLLKCDYLNKQLLLLLFEICIQCKMNFTNEYINEAINFIDNPSVTTTDTTIHEKRKKQFEDGKYKSIIENQSDKINKLLN